MKSRYIFLILSLSLCILSIAIVMMRGTAQDQVSLDSVSEIGEGVLHSVNKVGTMLTSVSDQDEMEIGARIHDKVREARLARALADTPIEKYIHEVGNKVAETVKRKKIKYDFHIVESSDPAAYAGPGGHVYVTVGLIRVLRSEAELAAVLAHEITHVDAKHCIGSIQYRVRAGNILGADLATLVDMGYHLFFRPGYSEVEEVEADAGGVYLLHQAGYHPLAMVHAFERIDNDELLRRYTNTSISPVGDTLNAVGGMITRYFATHPLALERIDKIKRYLSDQKLKNGNNRFYIGQRNYEEKISYKEKRYYEEFKKDYVIVEKKQKEPQMDPSGTVTNQGNGRLLNEVYTEYGRIASGMTAGEVEKILPLKLRAFKDETRTGYRDVTVYEFDKNGKTSKAGLWIELEDNKVKGMRFLK